MKKSKPPMTASEMGKIGGARRTEAQKEAARRSLKSANAARQKKSKERQSQAEANLAAIRERSKA